MPGRASPSVRYAPGRMLGAAGVVALSAAVLMAGLHSATAQSADVDLVGSMASEHQDLLSGTYSGAGLTLATDGEGRVAVRDVTAGSAAATSGLRVGDVVVRVADADVSGAHASQVARLLRGAERTKVSVVVRRGAADVDVSLERKSVASRDVHVQDASDGTRIIRVDRFSGNVAKAVEAAVLDGPSARGIVLDLRSNPGGRVDEAVAVASVFLDAGEVATLHALPGGESSGGDAQDAQVLSTRTRALTDAPLVVLVDSGSASAAELLTGALQDRGRAVVAGAKTFGKGTVQLVNPGVAGTTSVTTLATYTTPDGHAVDGTGLTPDVLLDDPVADADAFAVSRSILAGLV